MNRIYCINVAGFMCLSTLINCFGLQVYSQQNLVYNGSFEQDENGDSLKEEKNITSIGIAGNYMRAGIEYKRIIKSIKKINLTASVALGDHYAHPLSSLAQIGVTRRYKFISPFMSFGTEVTFGADRSRGFKTFEAYKNSLPYKTSAGANYWYKKAHINTVANAGINFHIYKFLGVGVYYTIKYTYDYAGYESYFFLDRIGVGLIFNF